MSGMQFAIFSVGAVTPDPMTGRAPTEAERIQATLRIATKVEEVGLDVLAFPRLRRRLPTAAVPHRPRAGLPLSIVLEQLDLLGEEVVPVLGKEFQVGRPEQVPDAPTHKSLVAGQ